jgi:amino acid transporter
MTSFFSLALSCMNAGARVIYQMGKQGFFHESTGTAHATNATPHIAVTIYAVLEVVIPTVMTFCGLGVSDAFNDAGTFGAFGFLGAYVFVCVAAPMYLKKIGQLKPVDTAWAVAGLVLLLVPAVGSVYPVPAPPVNWFPYIFGAYFAVGLVIFVMRRSAMKIAGSPLDDATPAMAT